MNKSDFTDVVHSVVESYPSRDRCIGDDWDTDEHCESYDGSIAKLVRHASSVDDVAAAFLAVLTDDRQKESHRAAARALVVIGRLHRSARQRLLIPALLDMVRKSASIICGLNTHVRQAILHLGPEAVSSLGEAMQAESVDCRRDIIWILRQMRGEHPTLVGPLLVRAALHDEDDSASSFGEPWELSVRRVATDAIAGQGGSARSSMVMELIDAMRSGSSPVRLRAAYTLEALGSGVAASAVPPLIEALRDADFAVRYAGASALGEMGSEARSALPALIEFLRHEDCASHSVSFALWRIAPFDRAVDAALIEALRHPRRETRSFAARTLGYRGREKHTRTTVLALADLLADPDWRVRLEAASALYAESIGFQAYNPALELAVPALTKALPAAEREARMLLQLLGLIGPPAKDAIPHIIRIMLGAESESERDSAAHALKQINPDGKSVAELVRSSDDVWEEAAKPKLKELKIFYLVFRVYMEGANSLRSSSEFLSENYWAKLEAEGLPGSTPSFSSYILKVEPLFSQILAIKTFKMFVARPGLGHQFTEDAQKAWHWTDRYLRKQSPSNWFGFSRLTGQS